MTTALPEAHLHKIVGYMNPLFEKLYPDGFSSTIKTRISNAYLIGEIFGMLFFGFIIDKIGRRTGVFFATLFLIFGVVLATAAHGYSQLGMFWMIIVGRGIAGFGAGGKPSISKHELPPDHHQQESIRLVAPVLPKLRMKVRMFASSEACSLQWLQTSPSILAL